MLSAFFFQSAVIGSCVVASQPAGIGIREDDTAITRDTGRFLPATPREAQMDIMLSLQGLGSFLLYFAAGIAAEAIFVALYIAVTPHREPTLIKAGNTAAAVSLGGAVLGFTLPLASAIANSVAIVDMAVWSGVALVVQLSVFLLASLLLRGISRRIEESDLAAGITLAVAALAIGIVNAASMTY